MAANPIEMPAAKLVLRASTANGRTVLHCAGKLTADDAERFRSEARRLLERSACLVLDLSELSYMDSSGVGALVSAYTTARRAGCDLRLLNPSKRVMDLLHVTNLASIFAGDFTEPTEQS